MPTPRRRQEKPKKCATTSTTFTLISPLRRPRLRSRPSPFRIKKSVNGQAGRRITLKATRYDGSSIVISIPFDGPRTHTVLDTLLGSSARQARIRLRLAPPPPPVSPIRMPRMHIAVTSTITFSTKGLVRMVVPFEGGTFSIHLFHSLDYPLYSIPIGIS